MKNILVVDDEVNIRQMLYDILTDEGYEVYLAGEWEEAYKVLMTHKVDVVLLDIWLPNIDGMEILSRIKKDFIEVEVIMISGHGSIDIAVKSIKQGAFSFIEKPLSMDKVLTIVENAFRVKSLTEENEILKSIINKEARMIGDSGSMRDIRAKISQAAQSNARVLITGENGTGKELIARNIHNLSDRRDKPFIEINCAAIPENLIESELFGHEKGSFTGAVAQKKGKFELANDGTIFLDEIADMSLPTQAKVLRVLQEMEFERVGGTRTIKVDVRIVAATNKDIHKAIEDKSFREDLYYRLNVIPIYVPPLRERREDIPPLIEYFLEQFAAEQKRPKKIIDREAMQLLTNFDWPGNIRELKNIIERLNIMVIDDTITYQDVREYVPDHKNIPISNNFDSKDLSLKEAKDEFEKDFIIQKLQENEMNISQTAKALNIERSHLHKKIKSYDIKIIKS